MTLTDRAAGISHLPSSEDKFNSAYKAILSGSGSPGYMAIRSALSGSEARADEFAKSVRLVVASENVLDSELKTFVSRVLIENYVNTLGSAGSDERLTDASLGPEVHEGDRKASAVVAGRGMEVDEWKKIAGNLIARLSVYRRLVEEKTGSIPSELLPEEDAVVHDAGFDARLEERLSSDDHVERRASEGFASVALDDAGRMVEYRPDGSTVVLDW